MISVHVCQDQRHDPSGVLQFVIGPFGKVTGIFGGLQPTHASVSTFCPHEQIDAISSVNLHRVGVHPHLLSDGGWKFGGFPG